MTKKVRLFQATKHVGIGTISGTFEVHGINCAQNITPALQCHLMDRGLLYATHVSENELIETLMQQGFEVKEIKK